MEMLWSGDGKEMSRCWKEMDESGGWRKDDLAGTRERECKELIRKVKTRSDPTAPEWEEEIWRHFNSQDIITEHTAMWDAGM